MWILMRTSRRRVNCHGLLENQFLSAGAEATLTHLFPMCRFVVSAWSQICGRRGSMVLAGWRLVNGGGGVGLQCCPEWRLELQCCDVCGAMVLWCCISSWTLLSFFMFPFHLYAFSISIALLSRSSMILDVVASSAFFRVFQKLGLNT